MAASSKNRRQCWKFRLANPLHFKVHTHLTTHVHVHTHTHTQVKIWDTAGSEKYMSISAVYYRKADGVVFVFDVTRPRSFTNIETIWMNAVDAPERSACLFSTLIPHAGREILLWWSI